MKKLYSIFLLLTLFINYSYSQITVTHLDLTGDGSLDLKVDNGIMWFQINGEDSTERRYIAAGGMSGQLSLVESIINEQFVDQSSTRPTINSKVFSVETHTNDLVVVLIEITNTSDSGKPYTQKIEISLAAGSEYATVQHIFENTGSSSFSFAEPTSHIGYGLGVAIVNHSEDSNVEAYINGTGNINLTSESWLSFINIVITIPTF